MVIFNYWQNVQYYYHFSSCGLEFIFDYRSVVVTNGENFSSISVLGHYVYWISGLMVMSVPKTGGIVEPVWTSQHHLNALTSVNVPSKKAQNSVAYWECINGVRVASHTDCTREGPCASDTFACVSSPGDCVPLKWRCDSADDCLDGSDEANCPQCGPDKFTCHPSLCIDMKLVCDGTPHCPDNSDERSCCSAAGWHQCSSGGGPSSSYLSTPLHSGGTICLHPRYVCDSWYHCDDRSDESAEACQAKTKPIVQESDGYVLLIAFVTAGFLIAMGYIVYRWRSMKSKSDNVAQVGDPALDPLSPKGIRNCGNSACGLKGYPAAPGHSCVLMSSLQRSTSNSQPSTNSLLCYPLNPPPSPATTSKETTRVR
ncbi:unnamed protein product, partial [Nesidiocoris tenuis]